MFFFSCGQSLTDQLATAIYYDLVAVRCMQRCRQLTTRKMAVAPGAHLSSRAAPRRARKTLEKRAAHRAETHGRRQQYYCRLREALCRHRIQQFSS